MERLDAASLARIGGVVWEMERWREGAGLYCCPACGGELDAPESADRLACRRCSNTYEVRRDLPRLLVPEMRSALERGEGEIPRTAISFGYEWSHFPDMYPEWEENFWGYMQPLTPAAFRGQKLLDAGCGSGRHAFHASRNGASVWAVDLGIAAEVAHRNSLSAPRVYVAQADLLSLPFAPESFDMVYSIGVLHHLPDPESAFRELLRFVKPGGRLHVYLYGRPEGQPLKRVLLSVVTLMRHVTIRLPHPLLHMLSYPAAAVAIVFFVWPYRLARRFPRLRELAGGMPLSAYSRYPFRVCVNDQFDRFAAPIERRYSRSEVGAWFHRARMENVSVLPFHGWVGSGQKPLWEHSAQPAQRATLVYMVTVPVTAISFLRGQLRYLQEHGFDVTLITSPDGGIEQFALAERVKLITIPMEREIHLWRDLVALCRLYRVLRRIKPDIVNASTPKAGFLGSLASWMARVPHRIFLVRGARAQTLNGLRKAVMERCDTLAGACANHLVFVGPSLMVDWLQRHSGVLAKARCVGPGSSNGVAIRPLAGEPAGEVRRGLGIPAETKVIGFVGRLTRDKGIVELVEVCRLVRRSIPQVCLLLVGGWADADAVPPAVAKALQEDPMVRLTGFVDDSTPYYSVMDILAFPSRREGFPNVPLEAAAAAVPTVAYRVTGSRDAVEDGVTGILVPPGDVRAFAEAVVGLLTEPQTRSEMGKAAFRRASQSFASPRVWGAWEQFYHDLLGRPSLGRARQSGLRLGRTA